MVFGQKMIIENRNNQRVSYKNNLILKYFLYFSNFKYLRKNIRHTIHYIVGKTDYSFPG